MPPTWADIRAAIGAVAIEDCEWAGLPMPVTMSPLVVESKHPRSNLNGFKLGEDGPPKPLADDDLGVTIRNHWYSSSKRADVYVWEQDGKARLTVDQMQDHWYRFKMALQTLGAVVEGIDFKAEQMAMEKLHSHVRPHTLAAYMMTGMFLETSQRSQVTYLFRRFVPRLPFVQCTEACCRSPHCAYTQSDITERRMLGSWRRPTT